MRPLHLAAYCGHVAIIRLLARHGAVLDVVEKEGQTPAALAEEQGHQLEALFEELGGERRKLEAAKREEEAAREALKREEEAMDPRNVGLCSG